MAKKAPTIPIGTVSDYRIIDKKRGHYEHKTKPEIRINRNDIEKLRAVEIGYTSRSDMVNSRKTYQYKRWFSGSLDSTIKGKDRGGFEKLYLEARKDNFNNLTPEGPLAKLLVSRGLRDADATYNVGNTPSKKPR